MSSTAASHTPGRAASTQREWPLTTSRCSSRSESSLSIYIYLPACLSVFLCPLLICLCPNLSRSMCHFFLQFFVCLCFGRCRKKRICGTVCNVQTSKAVSHECGIYCAFVVSDVPVSFWLHPPPSLSPGAFRPAASSRWVPSNNTSRRRRPPRSRCRCTAGRTALLPWWRMTGPARATRRAQSSRRPSCGPTPPRPSPGQPQVVTPTFLCLFPHSAPSASTAATPIPVSYRPRCNCLWMGVSLSHGSTTHHHRHMHACVLTGGRNVRTCQLACMQATLTTRIAGVARLVCRRHRLHDRAGSGLFRQRPAAALTGRCPQDNRQHHAVGNNSITL